jgi:succinoglycan biosynthesis transport protein ExoP
MTSPDGTSPRSAGWLGPGVEQQGLRRYVETIRERFWLVVISVVVTTGTAAFYVSAADKVYKASADLLVTPIQPDDPTLAGIGGLIRQSDDPTRDVETAARVVTTTEVARKAQEKLGSGGGTPRTLLEDVKADPVAQSNIITITAEGPTAESAAGLANRFAVSAVEVRTAKYHSRLDEAITRLRSRLKSLPEGQAGIPDSPAAQLARLEAARGGDDPTLRLETEADVPADPAWPRPALSILAGLFTGLILGVGGAFTSQLLDPRLRREEQVRQRFRLPVLARIPREAKSGAGALSPNRLSVITVEAFRTLRSSLAAFREDQGAPHSVLVTGPSPSEGKTTTSINLATSLAVAGYRVILIEADLRRPSVGKAFGLPTPSRGVVSALVGDVPLGDALVPVEGYGSKLKLLLADQIGEWMADRLSFPAAQRLVEEAKQMADYVIIDSPPLIEVIDALPLAQKADDVLLVVGLGKSHLTKLGQLGDLLAQHGIKPAGFVLVGVAPPKKGAYYAVTREAVVGWGDQIPQHESKLPPARFRAP